MRKMETNNTTLARMFFVLDSDNDPIEKFDSREELQTYLETNHEEVELNNYTVAEVNKLQFQVTKNTVTVETPDGRKRNRSKAERDPVTGKALKKDGTPYKSRKKEEEVVSVSSPNEENSEEEVDLFLYPQKNGTSNPEDVSF
jgi:hypothetical protein